LPGFDCQEFLAYNPAGPLVYRTPTHPIISVIRIADELREAKLKKNSSALFTTEYGIHTEIHREP